MAPTTNSGCHRMLPAKVGAIAEEHGLMVLAYTISQDNEVVVSVGDYDGCSGIVSQEDRLVEMLRAIQDGFANGVILIAKHDDGTVVTMCDNSFTTKTAGSRVSSVRHVPTLAEVFAAEVMGLTPAQARVEQMRNARNTFDEVMRELDSSDADEQD